MYSLMHATFMQRLSLFLALVVISAHCVLVCGMARTSRRSWRARGRSSGDLHTPVVGWRGNGGAWRSQRRGRSWLLCSIIICLLKLQYRVRKATLVAAPNCECLPLLLCAFSELQFTVFLSGGGRRRVRDYNYHHQLILWMS